MFRTAGDFQAFERVLAEAVRRAAGAVELFASCVMGNHWHLVIRTHDHRAMRAFMKWLTTTHAGRYRVAHGQDGVGHLYQGRYKSFMIEDDAHLLTAGGTDKYCGVFGGFRCGRTDKCWCGMGGMGLSVVQAARRLTDGLSYLSVAPIPGSAGGLSIGGVSGAVQVV